MKLKLQLSLLLSLAVCLIPNTLKISSAVAQDITSDGTTGTTVTNDGNNYTIQDGTRNGGNLFHSFQDFSVPTGGSAFFNNGNDISNILSRVTGGNISNIDGLIRANGSANLFLINPAGIIFGEGASLAIGGSFYGSTADSILFGDGEFSAVNNLDAPILTINAPIGLNLRDNPSDIVNNSVANDGIGLTILPETTLTLVGGNITFNSGIINAPGANVQFASLASGGNVAIDENLNLTLAENLTKADILFSEGSTVDVASDGGGSITIEARNVDLSQGSQLIGGIDEDLGVTNSQAGNITLNVSDAINLSGESVISNLVDSGTEGNSGDINIVAGSLELIEGSFIATTTFGQGNAGNILIDVNNTAELINGNIFSQVGDTGVGEGGAITVNSANLSLLDGAQITAGVFGEGNAGTVLVTANSITFQGIGSDGFPSGILNNVAEGGVGNAGNIEVTTANFNLIDGAAITSNAEGQGNAGNITIVADNNLTIADASNIGSDVFATALGEGGEIIISGKSISLSEGAIISTVTFPNSESIETEQVPGGNIELIVTDSLKITGGAALVSATTGQGDAGNITVNAQGADVVLEVGENAESFDSGSIFSSSLDDVGNTTGDAGDIAITAKSLTLRDGGFIDSSAIGGTGSGGNITVNVAENIDITDFSITSTAAFNGEIIPTGNAGNITINADSFSFTDASFITTSTFGSGNAGNITVDANNNVSIADGSTVTSSTFGVGNSGGIEITTTNLNLNNGGTVSASTFAQGNAGTVTINAADTISVEGIAQDGSNSFIASSVESGAVGDAGGVDITTANLELVNGGQISASTLGEGNAGTININTSGTISIDGQDPEGVQTAAGVFSNVEGAAVGNAGGINITTGNLNLTNGGTVAASTFAQGNAGTVTINATDTISVDGVDPEGFSSFIASNVNPGAVGDAGGIEIATTNLNLTNGGAVGASTFAQGNAGTVTINASGTVSIDGQDPEGVQTATGVFSNVEDAAVGNAGGVVITTGNLNLTNGGTVAASTFAQGNAGTVTINATDTISVDGVDPEGFSSFVASNVNPGAVGDAGGIEITTTNLNLTNGGTVGASTFAQGNAGTVTINASGTVSIDGEDPEGSGSSISSNVNTGAVGDAGGIEILTTNLNLTDGGTLSASTFGGGNAGTVTINATDTISIDGENLEGVNSEIASNVNAGALGDAGGIDITTANLNLTNGGIISASTFAQGNAGTVTIEATDTISVDGEDLESFNSGIFSSVEGEAIGNAGGVEITTTNLNLTNGGAISTITFAEGNAGTININASDTIFIDGEDLSDDVTNGGIFSNVQGEAVGNAGGVEITTANLNLTNGGIVAASTFAQGNAGTVNIDASDTITIDGIDQEGFASSIESNINAGAVGDAGGVDITTPNLMISNGAGIFANAFGEGDGGNITLNISDRLTLQENSSISVQASGTNATGGDITINAKDGFVVAFPNETEGNGSDIAAFSSAGAGGNIIIEAQGVLGLEERNAVVGNNTNDIDASGEIEDGSVEIITPSSDAIQAANQLPSIPVKPTDAVVQACSAQRDIANNNFVIKGKGGVPNEPSAMLSSEMITISGDETSSKSPGREDIQPIATSKGNIVPARGVEITENGRIILTAYETSIASRNLTTSINCN